MTLRHIASDDTETTVSRRALVRNTGDVEMVEGKTIEKGSFAFTMRNSDWGPESLPTTDHALQFAGDAEWLAVVAKRRRFWRGALVAYEVFCRG